MLLCTAVVGTEENIGGFNQLLAWVAGIVGFLQIVHHAAQTPVDRGHHGAEIRVLLACSGHITGFGRERVVHSIAVIFKQLAIARQHWPVNHPVPQVEIERTFLARFHKIESRFGHLIVRIGNTVGMLRADRRIFFFAQRVATIGRRGKIFGAIPHTAMKATIMIDKIKAILCRSEPDVPFTNMTCLISVLLHGIGHRQQIEV